MIQMKCDACRKAITKEYEVEVSIDLCEDEDATFPDGLYEHLHFHPVCFEPIYNAVKTMMTTKKNK